MPAHLVHVRTVAVLSSLAFGLLAGASSASAEVMTVRVSGHVTNPNAVAVDGAQVAVTCLDGAGSPRTTSGPDGSWSVLVPQGASCSVYAVKLSVDLLGTYYGNSKSVTYLTFAADTASIDVQLTQGGALAGRVAVPSGYSTSGMRVFAGQIGRWSDISTDGTYLIHGLTIGTHHAFVALPSGSDLYVDPADSPYVVTAGVTSNADFAVRVGASISGVVRRADGWAATGVSVAAVSADTSAVAATVYTDASGHYNLHALPPGSYIVRFGAEGLIYPYYPGATTSAGATKFELTDGMAATADQVLSYYSSVGGYVLDGSDSRVAGVAVSLEPDSGGAGVDGGTTDAYGMFHSYLPNLKAGSYRVRFVPPAGSGYAATYFGGPTRAHATLVTLAAFTSEVLGLHAVLPPASTPGRYVAQPPRRILDTRLAVNGRMHAHEYRTIDLDPGDTTGMTAAVLNITTTRTGCNTYLSAGPALLPTDFPSTSAVNGRLFADVPNMVTVQVAPGGLLTLYEDSCESDVVIDLEGYYTASGGAGYVPAPSPGRVLDTRTTSSALRAGETRRVDLSDVVPAGAVAAMVTLTTTRATAPTTYLSAFPTGTAGGTGTSVVNALAGADIANSAPVQLAADGSISIYNNAGRVDVIVDVVGWYTATGGAALWPVEPARTSSSGPLGEAQTRLVEGPDERIPGDAVAVALNLTTTHPTARTSYLVAHPAGVQRPATSNGNARAGVDVANGTIVALSGGAYRVYNNAGTVTVLEDVFGYFAPAA